MQDSNLRGPLSIMEIEYGKQENSEAPLLKIKLIMILLEQLYDKSSLKANEEPNEEHEKTKKYIKI